MRVEDKITLRFRQGNKEGIPAALDPTYKIQDISSLFVYLLYNPKHTVCTLEHDLD